MCFIFQQSIYIGKSLAELNLVLEAYKMKSCPSRSAPERCNPMEMHLIGMIHFLITLCVCVSAKKSQESCKAEEDATAQGSLGERAACRIPCSPDPTAKVWGWEEGWGSAWGNFGCWRELRDGGDLRWGRGGFSVLIAVLWGRRSRSLCMIITKAASLPLTGCQL